MPTDEYSVGAVRRVGRERTFNIVGEEEPLPVIPDPEVRGREALDEEVPRGAKLVVNAARKAGWLCDVRYARGPWLDADGMNSPYAVDSILVRGVRAGQRFAATWVRKPTGDPDKYEFSSAHWPGELGLMKSDDLKRRIVG